jgi:hypothetical protein
MHKNLNSLRSKLFPSFLILSLINPSTALAWSSSSTTITSVAVYSDGHVVIRFAGWSGNNACGSDQFSLGTAGSPQQRAMHAVALTALSTGKAVAVQTASGVCNGGQEAVTFLMVNQ